MLHPQSHCPSCMLWLLTMTAQRDMPGFQTALLRFILSTKHDSRRRAGLQVCSASCSVQRRAAALASMLGIRRCGWVGERRGAPPSPTQKGIDWCDGEAGPLLLLRRQRGSISYKPRPLTKPGPSLNHTAGTHCGDSIDKDLRHHGGEDEERYYMRGDSQMFFTT